MVLAHQVVHLPAVPFVVMALLRLPHPPTDRRRTQTIVDSCAAALGFSDPLLAGGPAARRCRPSVSARFAAVAVVQAGCAVVMSTVCIHLLARARQPGGLPFVTLGPVALGVLAHVVGLAILQMVLVSGARPASRAPGLRRLHRRVWRLSWLRRDPAAAVRLRDAAVARRREATAALAPVLPLVLAGLARASRT